MCERENVPHTHTHTNTPRCSTSPRVQRVSRPPRVHDRVNLMAYPRCRCTDGHCSCTHPLRNGPRFVQLGRWSICVRVNSQLNFTIREKREALLYEHPDVPYRRGIGDQHHDTRGSAKRSAYAFACLVIATYSTLRKSPIRQDGDPSRLRGQMRDDHNGKKLPT